MPQIVGAHAGAGREWTLQGVCVPGRTGPRRLYRRRGPRWSG